MEITKEQIERFISFAEADAGPECGDAYFKNICGALRKLKTKNKEAGDEKMETIRLDREDTAKIVEHRSVGPGGGGGGGGTGWVSGGWTGCVSGGGNAGSPESIANHIIIKEMRNALITIISGVVKIEAEFIDFGSPKEQERLKKKYGIDSKMPGGGGV